MADKVPRTERSWLSSCEGEGGESSPSNRPQTAQGRSRLGWRIRDRLKRFFQPQRATFAEADSGRTKTAWPIERRQGICGRDEKASDPAVLRATGTFARSQAPADQPTSGPRMRPRPPIPTFHSLRKRTVTGAPPLESGPQTHTVPRVPPREIPRAIVLPPRP